MSSRVPILVYHHVFPDDDPELAITTDKKASGVIRVSEFRRQVDYVLDNGWQVVSTTEIVDWLEGKGATAGEGRCAALRQRVAGRTYGRLAHTR